MKIIRFITLALASPIILLVLITIVLGGLLSSVVGFAISGRWNYPIREGIRFFLVDIGTLDHE